MITYSQVLSYLVGAHLSASSFTCCVAGPDGVYPQWTLLKDVLKTRYDLLIPQTLHAIYRCQQKPLSLSRSCHFPTTLSVAAHANVTRRGVCPWICHENKTSLQERGFKNREGKAPAAQKRRDAPKDWTAATPSGQFYTLHIFCNSLLFAFSMLTKNCPCSAKKDFIKTIHVKQNHLKRYMIRYVFIYFLRELLYIIVRALS